MHNKIILTLPNCVYYIVNANDNNSSEAETPGNVRVKGSSASVACPSGGNAAAAASSSSMSCVAQSQSGAADPAGGGAISKNSEAAAETASAAAMTASATSGEPDGGQSDARSVHRMTSDRRIEKSLPMPFLAPDYFVYFPFRHP